MNDYPVPDIFDRLKLRRVINVSGTETPFGGAPVCPEVLAATPQIAAHSLYMSELQTAASDVISRATGAEAGCVTGCTAASIAISIAATMTGSNLALAEQLPDTTGLKNEVVMQRGHEVTYGQNVSQNIRIVGARAVEIGAATQCSAYQLRGAIGQQTTAALYVISHLTVQERLIDLKTFCEVCHAAGVPVIVDAASQADPRPYLEQGADLVLLSAQKSFEGFTAGIIAGKKNLVRACLYQMHGIGRPMKVGKEGVIGAIVALERWMNRDAEDVRKRIANRTRQSCETLEKLDGVKARVVGAQVIVNVEPRENGLTAHQLAVALTQQSRSIIVWDHFSDKGELRLTLKLVDDETAKHVCERIAAILNEPAPYQGIDRSPPNLGDRILDQLENWPERS